MYIKIKVFRKCINRINFEEIGVEKVRFLSPMYNRRSLSLLELTKERKKELELFWLSELIKPGIKRHVKDLSILAIEWNFLFRLTFSVETRQSLFKG